MEFDLSIILPVYNEEEKLDKTITELETFVSQQPDLNIQLVFVDDGSDDFSAKVIQSYAEKFDNIFFYSYGENKGKGYAVKYGMLNSHGKVKIFTDADLAYGTQVFSIVYNQCLSSPVVVGSRNILSDGYDGYPPLRRIMSKIYIKIIQLAAGFKYSDSQAGIKGFQAEVANQIFEKIETDGFAFDLEVLMLADKFEYLVSEIPVRVVNHDKESSKVNPVKDTLNMLSQIRKIKKKVRMIENES